MNHPQNETPAHNILYNQNSLPTNEDETSPETRAETEAEIELKTIERPDFIEENNEQWQNFLSLTKELDLPPNTSQALIDFAVSQYESSEAQTQNEKQALLENAFKDSEFGGAQFEKSLKTAQTAMRQFADENFISLLEDSGLGNHPEMLRFFYRLGQHISEDKFNSSNLSGAAAPKSIADILYS